MLFDVKVPNAITRKAIAELEAGKGKKSASVNDLMADSHANEIDRSSAFKRDYKRKTKGKHRATLDDVLKQVLRWQPISLSMCATAITTCPATGRATANVASSPTCC